MLETRYLSIAQKLRTRIDHGDWEKKLPGISILSKEYDANPRTIAKALRSLSEEGRITILGTRGTFISQRPIRPRYNVIGVLGLIQGERYDEELTEIETMAKTAGYHLACIDHSTTLLERGLKILSKLPVDGLIFTNSLLTPAIAATLREAGLPFVSVNRITEIGGLNWVDFDSVDGFSQVYNAFLARGHRRIGSLSFASSLEEYETRMKTLYRRTMERAGCYNPDLYIHEGSTLDYGRKYGSNYAVSFGMEKAQAMLAMAEPPTAVVVNGIEMAEGFIRYVNQVGRRVPETVSIVAVSQNLEEAEQESFLTMLAGSARQRAKRITQVLLDLIENPDRPAVQEYVPMKLIEKKSVKFRT